MLKAGDKAPDFALRDMDGHTHTLSEFAGRKLILYFYPKDNTSGCTQEALGFKEIFAELAGRNAAVVGVSKDGAASHRRFAEKYGLPFLLLSDENLEAIRAYGVWQEKKLYGKPYMGVARTTFLIDETGRIEKVYDKVNVKTHAAELLAACPLQ